MANPEHLAILEQGVEVWNQWRKENPDIRPALNQADLGRADLGGADLTGAALSDVYLREAGLSGAILTAAVLIGAILLGADLSMTDLREAKLTGADLGWVDLGGANLSNADLMRVDLTGADLTGTDLTGALCGYTHIADVDLSLANGLELVSHGGPSHIDTHTFVKSKGKIPEVFLRGCGVPEEFITYMPSLVGGSAIQFYSCFISYSHADKSFARRVHDTLQMRGIRCWLDEHQMLPGHDPYVEIDRGIRHWDKVLFCVSEKSLASWWVDHELETLFEKERGLMREHGDKIGALIPLDLDGYLFTDECRTPKKTQIQSRLAANFQGWEHDNAVFEREIERVIKALRTDEGREPPPPPKLGKNL